MLPEEITDLVDRMLPEIAKNAEKGSGYYFYKDSGLDGEKWDILKVRLLADALITDPGVRAIVLTPEGQKIASEGTGAYKRFFAKQQRRANDSFRTNSFTRWGVIISGLALVISILACWVSWKAYEKPDDNTAAIQKLREARITDSVKTNALSAHVDSLTRLSRESRAVAKPSSVPTNTKKQPHGSTTSPAHALSGHRTPPQ